MHTLAFWPLGKNIIPDKGFHTVGNLQWGIVVVKNHYMKDCYKHRSRRHVQDLPDFGLNIVKFEGNQIERGYQLEFFFVHIYVLK